MTISRGFCFCQVDLLIAQTFKLIQGFTTMLRAQRVAQASRRARRPEMMSFSQGWDRATIDTKVSHLAELELVLIRAITPNVQK